MTTGNILEHIWLHHLTPARWPTIRPMLAAIHIKQNVKSVSSAPLTQTHTDTRLWISDLLFNASICDKTCRSRLHCAGAGEVNSMHSDGVARRPFRHTQANTTMCSISRISHNKRHTAQVQFKQCTYCLKFFCRRLFCSSLRGKWGLPVWRLESLLL